jgi:Leucine-rich repeat (LRR) protein
VFVDSVYDGGVSALTNLTHLGLANNSEITDFGVKDLTNLTSLSLKRNDCVTLLGVSRMINLTKLNLKMNNNFTEDERRALGVLLPNLTSLTHSPWETDF